MMASGTVPQLHFDGEPGIASGFPLASNGYGKLGGGDEHTIVLPGTCQLVQFGNTNWFVPAGAWHRKLSISTVTPSAPAPKTGLLSELLVSPQVPVNASAWFWVAK